MNTRRIYLYIGLLIITVIFWFFSGNDKQNGTDTAVIKVALREVGHQLLLADRDSTSLVLPVTQLEALKYKLSFQNTLSIEPDSLVATVKRSFYKAGLPEYYIVEVLQCEDSAVVYSYKMRNERDKNIVPCKGRNLPDSCYNIEVLFMNGVAPSSGRQLPLYLLIFLVVVLLLEYLFYKRQHVSNPEANTSNAHVSIGSFQFYPEQNKLVKQATEISLSRKECELLTIFVNNPNQIIKRDDLIKKVWEDNGVVVGRSLDTYISKLRKKLKGDDLIKLSNVHGVGYKLEIGEQ